MLINLFSNQGALKYCNSKILTYKKIWYEKAIEN